MWDKQGTIPPFSSSKGAGEGEEPGKNLSKNLGARGNYWAFPKGFVGSGSREKRGQGREEMRKFKFWWFKEILLQILGAAGSGQGEESPRIPRFLLQLFSAPNIPMDEAQAGFAPGFLGRSPGNS